MKIYTKTGDRGLTSLLNGKRVPKYDDRIEAYGTLDELNSYLGLVLSQTQDQQDQKALTEIQDRIFTMSSFLATDEEIKKKLPDLSIDDVYYLEKLIDEATEVLPPLKHFVLPGGHPLAAQCHVARCICRRAERMVVELSEKQAIDENIVVYLNRLSDYLFTLARKVNYDSKTAENKWIPRV